MQSILKQEAEKRPITHKSLLSQYYKCSAMSFKSQIASQLAYWLEPMLQILKRMWLVPVITNFLSLLSDMLHAYMSLTPFAGCSSAS